MAQELSLTALKGKTFFRKGDFIMTRAERNE